MLSHAGGVQKLPAPERTLDVFEDLGEEFLAAEPRVLVLVEDLRLERARQVREVVARVTCTPSASTRSRTSRFGFGVVVTTHRGLSPRDLLSPARPSARNPNPSQRPVTSGPAARARNRAVHVSTNMLGMGYIAELRNTCPALSRSSLLALVVILAAGVFGAIVMSAPGARADAESGSAAVIAPDVTSADGEAFEPAEETLFELADDAAVEPGDESSTATQDDGTHAEEGEGAVAAESGESFASDAVENPGGGNAEGSVDSTEVASTPTETESVNRGAVLAPAADASITLDVVTNFENATFSFLSNVAGSGNFDVTTTGGTSNAGGSGRRVMSGIAAGTYNFTQTVTPPPFVFAGVTSPCTVTGGTSFSITVADGESLSCHVQNNQAGIAISKATSGADGTFSFRSDIPGADQFELSSFNGNPFLTFAVKADPWTYSVTETVTSGFFFVGLDGDCTLSGDSTASVTVLVGATTSCTFTNVSPVPIVRGPFALTPTPSVLSPPVRDLPVIVGLSEGLAAATVGTPGQNPPATSFAGLSGIFAPVVVDGGDPPDTIGDVGTDHYVQMINTAFAVFDKSGNIVSGPHETNSLWEDTTDKCQPQNGRDPIVLYDELSKRWLLSQMSAWPPLYECVAVSTTSDPMGTYHLYEFSIPIGPQGQRMDYPKLGVWPDAYYLSTAVGGAQTAKEQALFAFDRAAMLSGADAASQYFIFGFSPFLMPADVDGPAPPQDAPHYVYTRGDGILGGSPNELLVYESRVDFGDVANSTFVQAAKIPIEPYRVLACDPSGQIGKPQDCAPQLGTDQRLDVIGQVPMWRLVYRNFGVHETLVGSFTVNVGTDAAPQAAVRWFELRKEDATWSLRQEGTIAPDSQWRYVPSIAIDQNGNIAIGYTISSDSSPVSIAYTTHSASDPLGSTRPESIMTHGTGAKEGGPQAFRWGDYSSMTLDPFDGCTFWYTSEYYSETGRVWNTRVGHFSYASCGAISLYVDVAANRDVATAGETITYAISYGNRGRGTAARTFLTAAVPDGTTFAGPTGWTGCSIGAPAGTICELALGALGGNTHGQTTFAVFVDRDLRVDVSSIAFAVTISAEYGEPATATSVTPLAHPPTSEATLLPSIATLPFTGTAHTPRILVSIALIFLFGGLFLTSSVNASRTPRALRTTARRSRSCQ